MASELAFAQDTISCIRVYRQVLTVHLLLVTVIFSEREA